MSTTVREVRARRSAPIAGVLRAHPVAAFFVLAYLFSWVYWLVVLGIMGRATLAWFVPGAFGPPLAALLVTGLVDGRDGTRAFLRRWVLWRVRARWYVLVLVGLPALGLLVGLLSRDWSERFAGSGPSVVVTYLATFSFVLVLGGGQEEPGWRGFALPRMQERMGPLAASVVLGVLWGLWHLPVFAFVPGYNSAGSGVASIAASVLVFTAVGAVGQSLLLTWLFNNTRGSVLLAVVAHASLNAGSGFVTGRTASMAVLASFGVVGLVLVVATRGTLSYRPVTTDALATRRGLANRVLIPVLQSTAGRRLGRRLAVVEYAGRRTAQRHQLVVAYRIEGRAVHIDVGMAARKTWWRNFETPHPVRLRLAGVDHDASAHLVRADDQVSVIADLEPSSHPAEQETS